MSYRPAGGADPRESDRKRHSNRNRALSGGSSVDQVNRTRSAWRCSCTGDFKGPASAVSDVSMPHTTGCRLAGKSSRTVSLVVGSRTARWNQWPHLSVPTV